MATISDTSQREGRALVARPSACLRLAILLAFGLLGVVFVPAAQAAPPPAPGLTGTDPASPGLSLTPSVVGSTDGVIIAAFPFRRTSAVTSATGGDDNRIYIYLNDSCLGVPFTSGTGKELETTGIEIEVEPEATTTITAKQEDPDENELSTCSNSIKYQQVKELPPSGGQPAGGGGGVGNGGTTVPPAAPRLRLLPATFANSTRPAVAGSAPGADSVRLFGVANCAGSPLTTVSPAQLAAGIPVRVTANAVTAFSAVSVGTGGASGCSAPVFYTNDSIAPRTRITMGPAAKTRRRVAVFRFTDVNGTVPGTRFFCKVNKRKWQRCKSPMRIKRLRPRNYVFQVMAVDPAGNQDAKPAKRRFKVLRSS